MPLPRGMKQSHRQTLTQALTPQLVKKMNVWDWREKKKQKNSIPFPVNQEGGGRGGFWEVWWVITFSFLPTLPPFGIAPRSLNTSTADWPIMLWMTPLLSFDKCLVLCASGRGLQLSARLSTNARALCRRRRMPRFETRGDNEAYSARKKNVKKNKWYKQELEPVLALTRVPVLVGVRVWVCSAGF